jgi:predicted ATPase
VLKRLDLYNFKAFDRFTVTFGRNAYLVGPNNAGKSTLIAALRSAAAMLRLAKHRSASGSTEIDGSTRLGHYVRSERVGLIAENLRHEFRERDTKLICRFSEEAHLEVHWPSSEDTDTAFFSLHHQGINLRRPSEVRRAFPAMGVVPVLAPFEHMESVLSDDHVQASMESRLASRHARNQLRLLEDEESSSHANQFEEFKVFAGRWITELELSDLRRTYGAEGTGLDLFYSESGSRIPKELFWTGDGMQIWVQLLFHIFRLRNVRVVVLDEPDLFLHPDLQRRLVGLLEATESQVIMATHSPEVLAEARRDAVIWIDRERRRGIRTPDQELLFELSDALGTQFNLRLAKALRARAVVFFEGDDMKLMRHVARAVGAQRVATEANIAVIPLIGFDRWEHVEPFQWMLSEFLGGSVAVWVILDRDYRDESAATRVRRRLKEIGIKCHVWERHEVENYLLDPAVISRTSGAAPDWVGDVLERSATELETEVFTGIASECDRVMRPQKKAAKTIAGATKKRFDDIWRNRDGRLAICPGKELYRLLNAELQAAGHRTVSPRTVARALREAEVPAEVRRVVTGIEADATGRP